MSTKLIHVGSIYTNGKLFRRIVKSPRMETCSTHFSESLQSYAARFSVARLFSPNGRHANYDNRELNQHWRAVMRVSSKAIPARRALPQPAGSRCWLTGRHHWAMVKGPFIGTATPNITMENGGKGEHSTG
jgi:hypothetical protein